MAFINYLISTNIPDLILYILISYVAPILCIVHNHYYKKVDMWTVIIIGLVQFNILSDIGFAYDLWVEHTANLNASSTNPINHFVEIQDDLISTEAPKMEESSTQKDDNNHFLVSTMFQVGAIVIFAILRSL